MKTNKTIQLLMMIALAITLTPVNFPVFAQSAPVTVRVSPAQIEVAINQTVDVAIEIVDTPPIYAQELQLRFDPAVVEVVDLDPRMDGSQIALGTFFNSGFVIRNVVDNLTGEVTFMMTQLNPSQPKSGSGNLVVLRLRGKQATQSASAITIELANIAQKDGTILQTEPLNAALSVLQTVTGPTNTPIPSQAAGTPMPTLTSTAASGQPVWPPTPTGSTVRIEPAPVQPTQQTTATAVVIPATAIPTVDAITQPTFTEVVIATSAVGAAPAATQAAPTASSQPDETQPSQTPAISMRVGPTATARRIVVGPGAAEPVASNPDNEVEKGGDLAIAGLLAGGTGLCFGGGAISVGLLAAVLLLRKRAAKP